MTNQAIELGQPISMPLFDALDRTGIYFLYRDGEVVYVGQAVDIRRRVAQHIGEGVKRFDAVSSIPCAPNRLNKIERYYIRLLVPEYNQCQASSVARRQIETGQPVNPGRGPALTAEQAARFIGVDIKTFYDMGKLHQELRGRRMPRSRIRRYSTEELRKFMQGSADRPSLV